MGRLTSKPISFKQHSLERISSYGQILSCPVCEGALMLKDTRDGDQAYWCHTCNRGWRAGHLPPEARRAKAKALLEAALEIEPEVISVPEVVVLEPEVKIKAARVAKIKAPEILIPKPEISAKAKTPRVAKTESEVILEPEVKIKAARVAKIKAPEVMLEPEIKAKRATKKLVLEVAAPPEPKIMPPPIVLPVPKRQAKPRQKTPLLLGQTEVQQNLFSS